MELNNPVPNVSLTSNAVNDAGGAQFARFSHLSSATSLNGVTRGEHRLVARESAGVISKWNQRDSPLLRLPAEIRNLIYVYALGVLILKTSKTLNKPEDRRRSWIPLPMRGIRQPGIHVAVCAYNEGLSMTATPVQHFNGLLKTCRQIHADTRFLLFELNTFMIHPNWLPRILDDLSSAQRDSTSVFQVGQSDPVYETSPGRTTTFDITNGTGIFKDCSGFHGFFNMKGLKRVIVGNEITRPLPLIKERERVPKWLEECIGDRDIEMVIPDPTVVEH